MYCKYVTLTSVDHQGIAINITLLCSDAYPDLYDCFRRCCRPACSPLVDCAPRTLLSLFYAPFSCFQKPQESKGLCCRVPCFESIQPLTVRLCFKQRVERFRWQRKGLVAM